MEIAEIHKESIKLKRENKTLLALLEEIEVLAASCGASLDGEETCTEIQAKIHRALVE